ncbi:MAG: ATP-dependent 6-phosphofructokinase [Ardenticatenaceae bacterium]|nr:ATP-dependent 6-phosphofructokinase [Ardenticatenaceae bacterium]
MAKVIGVLTAGGDTPGLNAAIRAIGKAALQDGIDVIGFRRGFRGMMENRTVRLDSQALSGILTLGGTILGTSRDKPHKMPIGNRKMDMTDVIVENYHRHELDCLICLGGGGTAKNAFRLAKAGLNVITLPKTIDNDVAKTDITFGFDTALGIAAEAIDRLHSTAHSHHRIIIVEIMGHRAGWLALGAGTAGGADVVLLPEIPYDISIVADAISYRKRRGKPFSIVAVAEGAMSRREGETLKALLDREANEEDKETRKQIKAEITAFNKAHQGSTVRLAQELENQTQLEARMTILGHVQRGGTPSARDRLLATRLGTEAIDLAQKGRFNVMVAVRGEGCEAVPLEEVAGKVKMVPLDHPRLRSARRVGTCMGDE